MSQDDTLLDEARGKASALGISGGACLDQIRAAITRTRAVHIIPVDGYAEHGTLGVTATVEILITSTDLERQLHDLGHLIWRHHPQHATAGGGITPHLRGRAAAAIPAGYTPQQEHEAEIMRVALGELLHA